MNMRSKRVVSWVACGAGGFYQWNEGRVMYPQDLLPAVRVGHDHGEFLAEENLLSRTLHSRESYQSRLTFASVEADS
jgi:hypothetical protein